MAAFTSLGIGLLLGALGGGGAAAIAAKKKGAGDKPIAPAPVDATAGTPVPPDTNKAASDAAAAAGAASAKQRKRALSPLVSAMTSKSTAATPGSSSAPRTLLGY